LKKARRLALLDPTAPRRALAGAVDLARRALDPRRNPFLAADLRIVARRRSLPRHLLLHGLTLGVWFLTLLWIARGPADRGSYYFRRMLVQYLVTGVAALHVWMVLHASNSRAREAAQREETARMWEMLLVTPLSPTEIVLFKSVYPALYAGLIALLALPVYLLAAAMSGATAGLLLMLYVVFGLLMVRLVAPVRPPPVRKRWRRPTHAANPTSHLFAWLCVLSFIVGPALRAFSPLAPALIFTWPVVVATMLPTPYPFYQWHLPPLAALLLLGAPVFLLNLRWAERRLVTHASESPVPEPAGPLRRGVVLASTLVGLGYAWPGLVESGRLGAWLGFGSAPGDSVVALAWLLLFGWWLLFGVGGLLNLPAERLEAEGHRQPRFFSGWMGDAESPRGAVIAVAALLLPPLLVWLIGCLLSGNTPPLAALPWLGRTVTVAISAALLVVALGRRLRAAERAENTLRILITWLVAAGLIVIPLAFMFWGGDEGITPAAVSPVVGFLVVLPARASLSLDRVGPLPAWWLSPLMNLGAAALLSLRWRQSPRARTVDAPQPASGRTDSWVTPWVERFAARWDVPVLVKELRSGARRSDWRRIFSRIGLGAVVLLLIQFYNPEFLPGLATGLPVVLIPKELSNTGGSPPGAQLLAASVTAVAVGALGLIAVFASPGLGAGTFSQERRRGTLGFLLLTPMRERQIVRQKLLGALAPLLIPIGLSFPLAALGAVLSLSPAVVWTLWFGYAWLLIACLTGGAFGMLASLLLPGDNDPQAPPAIAMMLLQGVKLHMVARLQYDLTGNPWYTGMQVTAVYVVPLVVAEAALGLLAYTLSVALLARARHRDLRFVTEK
jgi:hypothetical protein